NVAQVRGSAAAPPQILRFAQDERNSMDVSIAAAKSHDVPLIKQILEQNQLPTAGVDDHLRTFLVARDGERIVGCGGAETYPVAALLRSIAVIPEYRRNGVARKIVRHLIDHLASRGLREFYLLTTTAEEYFKKR